MPSRVLSEKQQAEFFQLLPDPGNITAKDISTLFAYHKDSGIKFNIEDVITIGPEQSKFVKPNSKTTIGLYIVNKFIFEQLEVFGYINTPLTGKTIKKIQDGVAKALMDGHITSAQAREYIDRCQYLFGGPLALICTTSLSETLLSLPKGADAQRTKLLAEHKAELDADDPQVAATISSDVTKTALDEMRKKHDPAMALFDSDCGVDPYNNYATIFVMKGAVQDNTGESPTGYKVVTSNYNTGVSKEDLPKIAESLVTSSYSSGILTADSGTNAKKYNALYQSIRAMPQGSDCKTTDTLEVNLTSDNAQDFMYRWILENGKLTMLDVSNIDKYIGKTIHVRSGIYCKAKHPYYCSKCLGDRPYRIGIKNLGLTFNVVSGSTLNASLKQKHNSKINTSMISIDKIEKYMDF